ncbi:MAG: coproporphyrinogen oxidase [Bacteroidetes bacterium]|nr:coproporphyrinogen oxidase [Bacteroidota bacterium]
MAGIYIHVPFCKTRCVYCDFYSNTGSIHEPYLHALLAEMALRKNYLDGESIDSIYLGGGTPSQLSIESLQLIFDNLFRIFAVNSDAEITIEANPDDLYEKYVEGLRQLPFNRLSMGVQTFDDEALRFLKRRHTGSQALDVVKRCQDAGFTNVSIDLMYGLPNQGLSDFDENIEKALALDIQHISAYHLIYEKGTKLFRMLSQNEVRPVDEELSVEMFSLLIRRLKEAGLEHYEISNFARNGLYSRHNTSYWQGVPYLGLGPSAHSFNGKNRQWNIASLNKYADALKGDKLNAEVEEQTPAIRYNDFVMTGLRTMWGIDLLRLETEFGEKMLNYCLKNARRHLRTGLLEQRKEQLVLSSQGIFVSDGVMSDLMWVD